MCLSTEVVMSTFYEEAAMAHGAGNADVDGHVPGEFFW